MLTEGPLVSIITPVFNRADLLCTTIDSVIAQTYRHWEMLLVDDGSTDGVESLISERYAGEQRLRFYHRDRTPKSASTCRNIGAERANGRYLIFLDSDDLLESFCLSQRVGLMESEPTLDFAVFPFRYLDPRGHYALNDFDNGKHPLDNFLANKSYWQTMCPVWRRDFFLTSVGGFNPNFPRYQDPELHIRVLTTPSVNYRMCMDRQPDTILIPSKKKRPAEFAIDVFQGLSILIPQTRECLDRRKETSKIRLMEGYLTEWLNLYAHANFDDGVADMTEEVFRLFVAQGVLSERKMKVYRARNTMARFLLKVVRKIYIASL